MPPGITRHIPGEAAASSGPSVARGPRGLADALAAAAMELGFARVGFTPVAPFERGDRALRDWLDHGYHGSMSYLSEPGRADPQTLLESARTLVVVALPYGNAPGQPVALRAGDGRVLAGTIARYARGRDYHLVLKQRLHALADRAATLAGRAVLARACVDTAPLLEREAASRAGVGFQAKNTLVIAPGLGSFVLLGELLLDVELEPSTPVEPRCGSCRACLDACPTGAFVGAHVLDARRCISYLTIEHTGVIPLEHRAPIGTRVFGCDVCQDVCPFNASTAARPSEPELSPRADLAPVDLIKLLELSSAGYRKLVKRTALRRASRETLARNAAIALGNCRSVEAEAPLARALSGHAAPIVRGHAAWALGELCATLGGLGELSLRALDEAERGDADGWVRDEAALARKRLGRS
jgi:epoxyqueuosine reductase